MCFKQKLNRVRYNSDQLTRRTLSLNNNKISVARLGAVSQRFFKIQFLIQSDSKLLLQTLQANFSPQKSTRCDIWYLRKRKDIK
jgi:hypothetical protein